MDLPDFDDVNSIALRGFVPRVCKHCTSKSYTFCNQVTLLSTRVWNRKHLEFIVHACKKKILLQNDFWMHKPKQIIEVGDVNYTPSTLHPSIAAPPKHIQVDYVSKE